MLFRTEFNMRSGEAEHIEQRAYRNGQNEVLVLDAGEAPPPGFVEFDPAEPLPPA